MYHRHRYKHFYETATQITKIITIIIILIKIANTMTSQKCYVRTDLKIENVKKKKSPEL